MVSYCYMLTMRTERGAGLRPPEKYMAVCSSLVVDSGDFRLGATPTGWGISTSTRSGDTSSLTGDVMRMVMLIVVVIVILLVVLLSVWIGGRV